MPRRWKQVLLVLVNLLATIRVCRSKTSNSEIAEILHRPIRALTFPDSSTTGVSLFLALAVPLDEPYKSISLAYFFEATYALPSNTTEGWPEALDRGVKKRSLDRTTVYQVLESKFESSGYRGRECLLRAICETAEFSLRHNGLIGDILHVVFTPSSSRQEDLPLEFLRAEKVGQTGSCQEYQQHCLVGLFDLIGVLV